MLVFPVNKDTRQGAAGGEGCEKCNENWSTERKETQKGGDVCTVEALFVCFPLSVLSFLLSFCLGPSA